MKFIGNSIKKNKILQKKTQLKLVLKTVEYC